MITYLITIILYSGATFQMEFDDIKSCYEVITEVDSYIAAKHSTAKTSCIKVEWI